MTDLVLLSGGVDSTALLWTRKKARALFFAYGQRHLERERTAAQHLAACRGVPLDVVDLPLAQFAGGALMGLGAVPEGSPGGPEQVATIVPGRNVVMLSVAASFAASTGCGAVMFAAHAGDAETYPDCRPEFVRAMGEAVMAATGGKVVLLAPFIHLTKAEIVGGCDAPLYYTYSCYNGQPLHCGRCAACVGRRQAFAQAGRPDLTVYANDREEDTP